MAYGYDPLVTAGAVLVGLVVGSFLNVVIHRVPRRESVVRPGSRCPACGAPIRWRDNLPVLSWLLLGGRCRVCRAPIPVRYPAVELAAAIVAVAALQRYGPGLPGAEAALFGWTSLALGVIDLEHRLLPDVLTYPSMAGGLAFALAGGLASLPDALLGLGVGAAIPTAVIVAYRWLRGVEGMGWGDVKYLGAIGAVLGWRGCLQVLVVASLLGAAVGLGLVAAGRGSRDTELPFGTFLALAVLLRLYAPPVWLALLPL